MTKDISKKTSEQEVKIGQKRKEIQKALKKLIIPKIDFVDPTPGQIKTKALELQPKEQHEANNKPDRPHRFLRARPLTVPELDHLKTITTQIRDHLSKMADRLTARCLAIPSYAYVFHFVEALDWLHQVQTACESLDSEARHCALEELRKIIQEYLVPAPAKLETATTQLLFAMRENKLTDFAAFLLFRVNQGRFDEGKMLSMLRHPEGIISVVNIIDLRLMALLRC